MRTLTASMALLAAFAFAVATAAPAMAGESGSWASRKLTALLGNGTEKYHFKVIHVADLATMRANGKTDFAVYDANTPGVRARYGKIPGAKLLSSSSKYNVSKLPGDKNTKLVFYCTNSH